MATGKDSRPKCPVCGALVADGKWDAWRQLATPVLRPEYQNPKGAERARENRRRNAGQ